MLGWESLKEEGQPETWHSKLHCFFYIVLVFRGWLLQCWHCSMYVLVGHSRVANSPECPGHSLQMFCASFTLQHLRAQTREFSEKPAVARTWENSSWSPGAQGPSVSYQFHSYGDLGAKWSSSQTTHWLEETWQTGIVAEKVWSPHKTVILYGPCFCNHPKACSNSVFLTTISCESK